MNAHRALDRPTTGARTGQVPWFAAGDAEPGRSVDEIDAASERQWGDAPTTTAQILRADSGDTNILGDLLGEACHNLAPAQWLVLNPIQRAVVLPAYLRIHVECAMTCGEVHVTADRSAVAVWFHHGHPRPEPASYPTRLALACGQWADRFRALEALLAARRPPWPHHYLAALAVRPDRQGQGQANALLDHHHAHLDQHGIPAYLQAWDPRSRELCQRHGYQPCGEPITLPNGAPLWPMWRPPATPPPRNRIVATGSERVGDLGDQIR